MPQLIDLGMAAVYDPMYPTSGCMGSPGFMAPEVVRGEEHTVRKIHTIKCAEDFTATVWKQGGGACAACVGVPGGVAGEIMSWKLSLAYWLMLLCVFFKCISVPSNQ